MKLSANVQKCGLSPMRKFHPYAVAAKKAGKNIYHLNIGQPDIITPPEYFKAIAEFEQPVLEYAPSPGVPSMVEAVQGYYKNIGVELDAADIFITAGGSEALQILMLCIMDEGSEVIVPEPFYPNYNTFVKSSGGKICPLPTRPETGYNYADKEAIEALINENTRAIMFTNPGNPTGAVLKPEEMQMIAEIAAKHDLYVIGDEVYREFVYGGEPLMSISQCEVARNNFVVIDSVSKRFSACGARVGCLITKNKELQGAVMKFCQSRLSVATLDQVASAALYTVDDSYFAAVRDEYKARRDTCYKKLMEIPGVVCAEPKGAFYLMAKLPVDDTEKFQLFLLNEFDDHGDTVMFAPGGGFYATPGQGTSEIRIAYVLKQERLERAMELLKLGIEAYNAKNK